MVKKKAAHSSLFMLLVHVPPLDTFYCTNRYAFTKIRFALYLFVKCIFCPFFRTFVIIATLG